MIKLENCSDLYENGFYYVSKVDATKGKNRYITTLRAKLVKDRNNKKVQPTPFVVNGIIPYSYICEGMTIELWSRRIDKEVIYYDIKYLSNENKAKLENYLLEDKFGKIRNKNKDEKDKEREKARNEYKQTAEWIERFEKELTTAMNMQRLGKWLLENDILIRPFPFEEFFSANPSIERLLDDGKIKNIENLDELYKHLGLSYNDGRRLESMCLFLRKQTRAKQAIKIDNPFDAMDKLQRIEEKGLYYNNEADRFNYVDKWTCLTYNDIFFLKGGELYDREYYKLASGIKENIIKRQEEAKPFIYADNITDFIKNKGSRLDADQKMYLVAIYFQSFNLIKSVLQIFLSIYYKNLYIWVSVEFLFSIIQCIILNWKINKEYPWLKTDKSKGKALLKSYPEILKKTKQIVIHQLKDFILTKSDEIMIFAFVSLKMVAYYGNYVMIISKLSTMFLTFFSGMAAGIGNLVADSSKEHIKDIFWQLSSAKYITAGILVFSLSFLINPFIGWWLGEDYKLSGLIVTLFMVNLYIMQTRPIVDMFNHSYGLYGDVWSAWAEGIINIVITASVAIKWGIIGILMGKIVSLFFIVVLWKPYYLFSQGIKEPITSYWRGVSKYHICFGLAFSYMIVMVYVAGIVPQSSIWSMSLFGCVVVLPTIAIYLLLFYFFTPGTKMLISRISVIRKLKSHFPTIL